MQQQCTAEVQGSSYKETGEHLVFNRFLGAERGADVDAAGGGRNSQLQSRDVTAPLATAHCSVLAVG